MGSQADELMLQFKTFKESKPFVGVCKLKKYGTWSDVIVYEGQPPFVWWEDDCAREVADVSTNMNEEATSNP